MQQILGVGLWQRQKDVVLAVRDNERVVVPSCVSSGKSHVAGAIIPWWLHTHYPARVFTIAPTERQLKINLWGEFGGIYGKSKVPLGGRPLQLDWVLESKRWYAQGFAPKEALNAFGVHGPNDLFIFDDGQGIEPAIFDAFENAFAGGTSKMLILCNPVMTSGTVYDAITKDRGDYKVVSISAFDTPNVQAGHIVVPGLITKEMVERWARKYGTDSAFYRAKVLGLPPKQGADTLIPLEWLELAKARTVPQDQGPVVVGMDVARFGDDDTSVQVRNGRQLLPQADEWKWNGKDTAESAGRLVKICKETGASDAYIDVIGVGAGVVDQAREQIDKQGLKINIIGVNVAENARGEEEYANLRSEAWWAARESLDPKNPAVVSIAGCSEDLIGDLSAVKYKVDSAGRVQIEKKEDIKKRLGRSPDDGDAYCLCVMGQYTPNQRPGIAWSEQGGQQEPADWEG